MKTPVSYNKNLKAGIITEEMLANCLYSVNKRAKNCRDKVREYKELYRRYYDLLHFEHDYIDSYSQKREELRLPLDGIREIDTYYDYSNPNPHEAAKAYSKILDEFGYIFDTYEKIEETVMDYFAGVNNLLWNITQEEACEVLGLDFNKAILLNIDCRDEASALLNEMFKETEYTDFSIVPYSYEEPCRLEVVGHKDFWNMVDYFNEKRKTRGGEKYV